MRIRPWFFTALVSALCVTPSSAPVHAQTQPATGPAWLGVMLDQDLSASGGVVVERVMPGSPALAAGIRPGEVILRLNGTAPATVEAFVQAISAAGSSATVVLDIEGRTESLPVLLGPRPPRDFRFIDAMVGQPLPQLTVAGLAVGDTIPLWVDPMPPVTVIEFWATWCGPCHVALPWMVELRETWPQDQLRMISISNEDAPTIAAHLVDSPMPWLLGSDVDDVVGGALWVDAFPTWIVVDHTGTIVMTESSAMGIRAVSERVAQMLTPSPSP
jgi:thiol-disulfide isomerase/thioredoxin